ncbi:MAG: SUMF1/EgtB/PvdO family nonheme iron enzyme [Bacteroidales bacterium]|nr:SUMF1/EgtB/PvdO family nonheme iron enzyme [Bacteroidales bacterium]
MRRVFILLFAMSAIAVSAQKVQNVKMKDIEKSLVKISESVYVSKYEISNKLYGMFLSDLNKSGKTDLYAKCYPDTAKWHTKYCYYEPFVTLYHAHPAYFNHPVVNIDKKSAEEFCKWLTSKYNDGKKHKFEKIEFRLPTEAEWKTFASTCTVLEPQADFIGPKGISANTVGNVSEMTSDGTALGNNWAGKEISMPEPWVGFRIAATVK